MRWLPWYRMRTEYKSNHWLEHGMCCLVKVLNEYRQCFFLHLFVHTKESTVCVSVGAARAASAHSSFAWSTYNLGDVNASKLLGFVKFHNDANGTKYASIPMHQSKEWLFPVNPVWYFICCWVCCHPSECSLLLREHYEKVACLIFCPLQMPLSTSSSFCVTYETRVK